MCVSRSKAASRLNLEHCFKSLLMYILHVTVRVFRRRIKRSLNPWEEGSAVALPTALDFGCSLLKSLQFDNSNRILLGLSRLKNQ